MSYATERAEKEIQIMIYRLKELHKFSELPTNDELHFHCNQQQKIALQEAIGYLESIVKR